MTYAEIEAERQRIGDLSRAAMCRRANVSESAVAKGLKLKRKPIDAVRDKLLKTLADHEAECAARTARLAPA